MTTFSDELDPAWPGPARIPTDGPLTFEELQRAGRNRGMPLEALRYDVTPTGLHYLLIHFDISALDPDAWRLRIDGLVDRPLELRNYQGVGNNGVQSIAVRVREGAA